MVVVTSIISNQEWIRLRDAAAKPFPNDVLAREEIMCRYAMSGIAALKNLSEKALRFRYGNTSGSYWP
jgi:hypothetical protein